MRWIAPVQLVVRATRVAGFMNDAKQRTGEFVFIVTRGDPYIFRYTATEGMGADVETPSVKVETQQCHGIHTN